MSWSKAHIVFTAKLCPGLKLASLHSMAVDYVKTGQPALMPRDLKPPKWPHFMERHNLSADRIYTSRKVLGQLYDQVERVDFVPAYRAPFDDRILNAYKPDADMLDTVRNIKSDYDAHIRRIMAQHEVKTEFEVWSTFVLQHSRTTNAFKFHEVIWELSVALKEQFRKTCYEWAGGKDFNKLAPFVAAMYIVTHREMADAVWECPQFQDVGGRRRPLREMTADTMPLMSFPWLFPDVLGKIAKGHAQQAAETVSIRRNAAQIAGMARSGLEAAAGRVIPSRLGRSVLAPSMLDAADDIETAGGVTHRGDMLQLFETNALDRVLSDAATGSSSSSGLKGSPPPLRAGMSSQPELMAVPLLTADTHDADEHQEATKLAGQAIIEPNMEDGQYISPEDSDAEAEVVSLGLTSKPSLMDRLMEL